ncbi:PAS domain-containing protein [Phreatobacter aquaticus]|uniref:Blue-light-activated histidine kinase n=1 Tax=Phreatobacter aquaticus TaxID=2570229 RepID=A0A4D7QQZ8_9HYPH|nr:HWE histidine kinase domain-containing protein [Phreatobacter aquaticus]QCK88026.1 PAS domain-containing protein [Phreatobacter aquaticus]
MPQMPPRSETQDEAAADVEGFKEDLGPFVVAAETTRMPMVFTDAKQAENSIIFANDSFISLIGYERNEVLGQGFNFVLASATDAEPLAAIKAGFEEGFYRGPDVCCRRKDGSAFWAGIYISPVRDESGDTVQHFASLVDLTRYKDEQARSGALIDELNDRVRNMLAAVQSIVTQAFRKGTDPTATREFIALRIAALSRSHALLAHGDWGRAGLRDIVDNALEPFTSGGGRSGRYVVTGDDIRFSPKRALALGIALHELVLNAVIHGALSNDSGSIMVSWRRVSKPAGDRLILVWHEKDGPSVTPASKKGFGSRVIEDGLAHELEATVHLDYPSQGVVCTIDMAFPRDHRDE